VPLKPSSDKGQEQQRRTAVAMPYLPRPQEPCRLYQGETMKTYPSKELCLRLAEYHCETTKDEKAMWVWLVTWAFHEMYIEGWITK
jgi:hypothetical protein